MTDIEALRARMRETAESGFDYLEVPASDCLALDAEITRLREDLDRVTRERDGAYLTSQQAAQSYSNLMRVKEDIDVQRQDAEAALAVVTRERDEALAYVKDATVAITELTSGGSEFFGKRIAGIYTADLPFCVQRIRETRASQFEHIRKLARELKAAEAALAKRDEEVTRLRDEIEARRDGSTADRIIANWFDLGRGLGLPAGASVWEAVMKMRETLRTVDGHYDMLGYAKDSIARTTVREAHTKEPTNAE